MSLRSRLAISLAIGILAAAATASPAAADEDWGHHHDHDQRPSKGVVTADTLLLRSAPNRGSQVIRTAHRGDTVKIFCQAAGESVQGNPLWYLLPDGTWAWGSARYIKSIGAAPRWC
ncbi:SH3 domain-containing protein [Streptomyces dysideae]|uniref:SH3b domain-containing protein n=1 Tax=Streptomyces dysideae TaxID=909626 RepID=A0A101UQ48_9ACTN|nr:SH3 domain-containing protein [Streptomyces dysideae]KUO14745.1 hypothetical protein AQJ91_45115 [Streptomyces dysideae]